MRRACSKFLAVALVAALSISSLGASAFAQGFQIVVDYTYDTNNFFDTQTKRDALQAAADRFSRVITSELTAVGPSGTGSGTSAGWRIGFNHPGTGSSFQISTAASFESDPLSGGAAADVYQFGGLAANQWTLFAGGRALSSAGVGGTGTGLNFTSTFNDLNGPMHRGVISNTPDNTVGDLPAWGGSVSFNTGTNWHFGIDTPAAAATVDFYSIALHEIGHALGLSAGWNQLTIDQVGSTYLGAESLAAYNLDNMAALTGLELESETNQHWKDGLYKSFIFEPGDPSLAGTVGLGTLQDLLLEPTANFTGSLRRFELTNVDVAHLRDLGWSTISAIPEPSSLLVLGLGVAALGCRRRRCAA